MAVVPGVVGQNSPTVQTGLVPFLAGQGAITLGFVEAVAALGIIVAAAASAACIVDASSQLAVPVTALTTIGLAPAAIAEVGDQDVSATIRLNTQTLRRV